MLQIEILKNLVSCFNKMNLERAKNTEKMIITDLEAIAFHRVMSSETDKTTHFISLWSFFM